ncbi:MAG TPA: fumarylacetoacetate hydrolase family protein [Pseudomonadales bacterium]|nr:fumarylacetoacetate hydrolase family protein [Pseudomonadales bacterium]
MRWISFERAGRASYGVVVGNGIVDVGARRPNDRTLKDLLASGDLEKAGAEAAKQKADHALADVKYLPVITNPDKILCVGINYKAHQEETGRDPTSHPTIFVRFAAAQIGHDQPMIRPEESDRLDFEGEIALVIGKRGRRIPEAKALDYVAGFSCYNDGSVRDYQRHTTQFTPGKNFTGTGGFGPWLMTKDECGNLGAMELTTRLNGEVMQNATASLLIFGFEDIIAYCSTFTDLVPGDVIVTGTPGGVGAARNPPLFMKAGDVIEVEVKPIGVLRNRVVVG